MYELYLVALDGRVGCRGRVPSARSWEVRSVLTGTGSHHDSWKKPLALHFSISSGDQGSVDSTHV